jgi:hypothetical protein
MFLSIFTLLHVAISLVAIGSGFVVMCGLLTGRSFNGWAAVFLVTTIATSVTGFGFPFVEFLPSHAVGLLSLVLLTFTLLALYRFHLAGAWRWIYVITAVAALYFNVFVLVVQAFEKVGALKAIAPTQSEPPFAFTQAILLGLFVLMAVLAVIRFPGDALRAAAARRRVSRATVPGRQ